MLKYVCAFMSRIMQKSKTDELNDWVIKEQLKSDMILHSKS